MKWWINDDFDEWNDPKCLNKCTDWSEMHKYLQMNHKEFYLKVKYLLTWHNEFKSESAQRGKKTYTKWLRTEP